MRILWRSWARCCSLERERERRQSPGQEGPWKDNEAVGAYERNDIGVTSEDGHGVKQKMILTHLGKLRTKPKTPFLQRSTRVLGERRGLFTEKHWPSKSAAEDERLQGRAGN